MGDFPEGWSWDGILALSPSSCAARTLIMAIMVALEPSLSQCPLGKGVTKALGPDSRGQRGDKTPGGAPGLGWGVWQCCHSGIPPRCDSASPGR